MELDLRRNRFTIICWINIFLQQGSVQSRLNLFKNRTVKFIPGHSLFESELIWVNSDENRKTDAKIAHLSH